MTIFFWLRRLSSFHCSLSAFHELGLVPVLSLGQPELERAAFLFVVVGFVVVGFVVVSFVVRRRARVVLAHWLLRHVSLRRSAVL